MLKPSHYRISPTTEQKVLLAKSFGCCRQFYDFALNLTNETYKTESSISYLTLKKEYKWLTEISFYSLQQVDLYLSSAFLNFFEKRAKFPKYYGKYEEKLARRRKQLSRK